MRLLGQGDEKFYAVFSAFFIFALVAPSTLVPLQSELNPVAGQAAVVQANQVVAGSQPPVVEAPPAPVVSSPPPVQGGTGHITEFLPKVKAETATAVTQNNKAVPSLVPASSYRNLEYYLSSGEVKTSNKTITFNDMREYPSRNGPIVTITTNSDTYQQNDRGTVFIGLTNPEAKRPVDFYFVMLSPEQDIYFYPDWTKTPKYVRVTLPANLHIPPYGEGSAGMMFEVPSKRPPITEGHYVFAAGVAKQGTLDFYSIDDTGINVQGGSDNLAVQLFPEEAFINSGESQDFFAVVSGTIDGVFAAPQWEIPPEYCQAEFCNDGEGCTVTCTNPTSQQLALDITFKVTEWDAPFRTARDTGKLYVNPEGSSGNTPPVASFTVYPNKGTTSTDFFFDAGSSRDAQDDISQLEVRWDWEGDGWDTGFSPDKTAYHRYSTEETKTVRLEVRDAGGMTNQITKTVYVDNSSGGDAQCSDIYIAPDNATVNEWETTYRNFYYENNSDERFSVEGLRAGVESGSSYFDVDETGSYDGSISAHGTGSYELRIEGRDVDRDESGTAYVEVEGRFEGGGRYCSFGEIARGYINIHINNEGGGGQNERPYIDYVDVYPETAEPGEYVDFEVYWSDPEYATSALAAPQLAPISGIIGTVSALVREVQPLNAIVGTIVNLPVQNHADANLSSGGNDRTQTFICKSNSAGSEGCNGGTWCETDSYSSYSPSFCEYRTSASDEGDNKYYAFVCDDEGLCSYSESGTFYVGNDNEPSLSVSISPSDPTVKSGDEQKFTAQASGGNGSYDYSWSLSSYSGCNTSGENSKYFYVTCTNNGSSTINRTVYLNVESGGEQDSASTKLYIDPDDGGSGGELNVSIDPDEITVDSGYTVYFDAEVSGGTGSYTYDWSISSLSNCSTEEYGSHFDVTCTNTSSSTINKTIYLDVESGSKSGSAEAKLHVGPEDDGGIGPDIPNPCKGRCDEAGLWGCQNDDPLVDETKTFPDKYEAGDYFESLGYHEMSSQYTDAEPGCDFGKAIEKGYRWEVAYTVANGTIDSEGPEPNPEYTQYMWDNGYWPIQVGQWHAKC